MKGNLHRFRKFFLLEFCLASLCIAVAPIHACTIFVLTDTNRALFCNNEDWSDPQTRIWFVPASKGRYGCVRVGFENNWAQGGLNTEGLAYDWVAGYQEIWKPDPHLPRARGTGNTSDEMLETCATIEQAVAFFKTHQELGFYRAKIIVADRTGASVIIGAQNGVLDVQKEDRCRGFGYGESTLAKMLVHPPEPSANNGFKILRASRQQGQYSTKYSNVFDLKTGDIFLYPFPDRDDEVKFNLADELKKSGHYYDMLKIHEQMVEPLRPLLPGMTQKLLGDFKPIPDKEPEITAHLKAMLHDAAEGTPRETDYKAELWKTLAPLQTNIQASLKILGNLDSLTLVDRTNANQQSQYRYRLDFKNATLLQYVAFDEHGKLSASFSEDTDWKITPPNPVAEHPLPTTGSIGVVLRQTKDYEPLIIEQALPGTPAERAGLKPGSLILSVNGAPAAAKTLKENVDLIRGVAGTSVTLEIADADLHQTNTLTLKREALHLKIGVTAAPLSAN